jgi:predicted MFS family arabinose efflux permease
MTKPKFLAAYALSVLTLVSFFNYMDRMVLAVLLEPMRKELHLSDAQLGMLTGLAFAFLYALLGIPLARFADRASRVKLLAACLGLWSLMTAATGLARSFPALFLARMGVGIGEAGCVPAAHSLIGDYFSPERRAMAVSTFQAGALAGVSAGLFAAGMLAEHFGWRNALFIVGLSGLPLGLLVLTTFREPERRGRDHTLASEGAFKAIGGLLRRRSLVNLIVAISLGGFGNYGINQWLPSFYVRSFGISLGRVGMLAGMAAGIGGVLGVLCGGVVAMKLIPRDKRWELWLPAIVYSAAAPAYVTSFLNHSLAQAVGINMLATFLVASGGGVALSALQSYSEPNRRALAISLTLFLSSLVGLGLGPLLVGVLSDHLKSALGQESLRYALLCSTLSLVWAGVHFYLASRTADRDRI